jgi:ketosteroid isomerase-like protein
MKKINSLMVTALLTSAIVLSVVFSVGGCNNTEPVKEEAKKEEATVPAATTAVTNPNFGIAPIEYADLSQKALDLMSKFEFDAWAEMLADNVIYTFPDGDVDSRTTLEGKAAVVNWWKSWKEKSGVESMTMSEFNHFPLNVTAQPKGGATMGNYDFVYFSNKMVFGGKPVSLRMNFVLHFNADKKIDRYITYYDRAPIIKAMGGKSILEDLKTKK